MDDIEEGKIGKKDEKLVGWDHIRKPKMNTNYPPMRARGAGKKRAYSHVSNSDSGLFVLVMVFLFILTMVFLTKMIGVW
jgi:hypothetical protein